MPDSTWLYGNRDSYRGQIIVKNWEGKTIRGFSFGTANRAGIVSTIKEKKQSSLTPPKSIMQGNGPVTPICIDITFFVKKNCTCSAERIALQGCDNCPQCKGERYETYCSWPFPDNINNEDQTSSGNGNSGGGYPYSNGNASIPGGSPVQGDYPPPPCTDGPQIVNSDGSMSPPPCVPVPQDPPPPPTITAPQFLINNLILTAEEINFVNDFTNSEAVNAIAKYLAENGLTIENKEFAQWSVGYIINHSYDAYITSLIQGIYENTPDSDAESTSSSFNFDNVATSPFFNSNGINIYGNAPSLPDYPANHPVCQAIASYSPWIYLALANSNNTSIRHFHKQARALAGGDGWGKAIGAIGEGLAARRVTSWPTSPGFEYRVGFMVGTTHLDGLQWGFLLKTSSGIGWGLNVVNSDLNGNEVITKMKEPDGPEVMGQKIARIAYEIKTISPYNEPAYLWASFSEGIKQAEHRANSTGISASVLIFDSQSFMKLKNSIYGQQLLNRLAIMFSRKNSNGEQKVFLRLESNLYADARSSYFALIGRFKNLPE